MIPQCTACHEPFHHAKFETHAHVGAMVIEFASSKEEEEDGQFVKTTFTHTDTFSSSKLHKNFDRG